MPKRRLKKPAKLPDCGERLRKALTDEIEECFQAVTKALKKCDLPPAEVVAWCKEMIASDRVGFIYDAELRTLQKHFEALRS
jgi:hypothetical protein